MSNEKQNNWNISLDGDALREGLQEASNKAIAAATSSYDIEEAIAKGIRESIFRDALIETIKTSISQIDFETMTTAMAKELSNALVTSTTLVMKDATFETLCRIKGIQSYDTEGRAKFRKEFDILFKRERKNR